MDTCLLLGGILIFVLMWYLCDPGVAAGAPSMRITACTSLDYQPEPSVTVSAVGITGGIRGGGGGGKVRGGGADHHT